ncbi:hypothetical protein GCM10009844_42940 [Nocardioides koreensis]|uniref:Uncharacterized protein n=1 Tax=Nocardioides koreensis TaxID=433651 RepID=A0ABP5LWX7_9ACTN
MTDDTGQKLGIDWLKTIAGALAAVSSAVLLSTLGAAGTIIGAALGSVVVTVGGALYGQGLARSRERLAQVPVTPRRKVVAVEDESPGPSEQSGPGWRERLGGLPWKRISLGAAGLFAATVVAITVFELAAGRTVSSITGGSDGSGGTTLTRIGGGSHGGKTPDDDQSPSDGTTSPSDESSEPATPTDEASSTDRASPTDRGSVWSEPTDEVFESPSDSPSPAPTPATPTTPTPTLPPELTTTPPAS